MQHQDWTPAIVHGKSAQTKTPVKKIITTPGNKQETATTIKKIYDSDSPNEEPEIRAVLIDKDFAMKMCQARAAKKLTQKQLAQMCMLDVKIIISYEKGGCPRNGSYITKIKKVLGAF